MRTEAWRLVYKFFKNKEKTKLWFRSSNPLLGGLSANQMIRLGRYDKLLRFVKQSLADNVLPNDPARKKALDELTAESQRLGLYD